MIKPIGENSSMKCPYCGYKNFRSDNYYEFMGLVESHEYCKGCGYILEMAYSSPISGIVLDVRRGHKAFDTYIPKNIRKRKRYRRKGNIKVTQDVKLRAVLSMI